MPNFSDLFASGGGKLRFQKFTSSGTFYPPAPLVAAGGNCWVKLKGGGGPGSVPGSYGNSMSVGGSTTFAALTARGGVGGISTERAQIGGAGMPFGGTAYNGSHAFGGGGTATSSAGEAGTGNGGGGYHGENSMGGGAGFEVESIVTITAPTPVVIGAGGAPFTPGYGNSGGSGYVLIYWLE